MISILKNLPRLSCALAFVAMAVMSPLTLFAADEWDGKINVPSSGADFSSLVAEITGQLFPVMAMAGGLGLAIWVFRRLFISFKSMGK